MRHSNGGIIFPSKFNKVRKLIIYYFLWEDTKKKKNNDCISHLLLKSSLFYALSDYYRFGLDQVLL